MNVRAVLQSLLEAEMDAEVGVIHDGRFYPVRTIAERADRHLRLGITGEPAFKGGLHIISFTTRAKAVAIQLADLDEAKHPLNTLTHKQAKRIRKDYKKSERKK
jgi:hypothetical protein